MFFFLIVRSRFSSSSARCPRGIRARQQEAADDAFRYEPDDASTPPIARARAVYAHVNKWRNRRESCGDPSASDFRGHTTCRLLSPALAHALYASTSLSGGGRRGRRGPIADQQQQQQIDVARPGPRGIRVNVKQVAADDAVVVGERLCHVGCTSWPAQRQGRAPPAGRHALHGARGRACAYARVAEDDRERRAAAQQQPRGDGAARITVGPPRAAAATTTTRSSAAPRSSPAAATTLACVRPYRVVSE